MNGVAVIIMSCLSHDFDIFMHVFRPVFKVSHLNIYILTLKHRPNEFGHWINFQKVLRPTSRDLFARLAAWRPKKLAGSVRWETREVDL